jgi:hypothetical protein
LGEVHRGVSAENDETATAESDETAVSSASAILASHYTKTGFSERLYYLISRIENGDGLADMLPYHDTHYRIL